ncbi:hypothetical protein KAR91_13695 [Candidatus Pacearchaeota archaeon]|nr:hypothetical protein [Candidatus Pacearchaeota archaeon]
MNKTNFYKELYSIAKGRVLSDFFIVRKKVFTKLLQKCELDQREVEDCVIKSTEYNVYISAEKLLDKVPEEAAYQLLVETKNQVLKRLPTFIKMVTGTVPIDITEGSPYWSEDGILINIDIVDSANVKELERYLGQIYWSLYGELTDYTDSNECGLLEAMGNLACRDKTIGTIGRQAAEAIDNLSSTAKFTRIQALIKSSKDENNIMLELMKLNTDCKE